MSGRAPLSQLAPAALVAGLCALTMGWGLARLATPAGLDEQLTTLQQQTAAVARLVRRAGGAPLAPRGLICNGDPSMAAQRLRATIRSYADQSALVVDGFAAMPSPLAPGAALAPIQLRVAVSGSYEGVLGLLAVLEQQRPQIFVDSIDLTPQTSSVTLSFTGRLFCAA